MFLSTSDYAVQEVFLAAATLEFTLSFIHQMEVLQFVLSPVFWVEMATLPPCTVLIYLSFCSVLEDYRISQVLLLTGSLRWLKSFGAAACMPLASFAGMERERLCCGSRLL